ncbi:hypothetical protein PHLGIDRAFT_461780 [Phlebiopsis gigantea 11061_1 CR5-6]|uniref:Uncharacterized protein n=1 Tax=Phlebiopsis gigantea (strain 11061_1 CR5-6) TaxID=745531 RepID=A0A0C3S9Q4_PHLG1|nr:hypothetical protein PHLGIDRAFT_461780 [Phlebiopsis gigantea 11061_1 CR5-6]
MWLRAVQLTATARHIPKLPSIQPTQPLLLLHRSPRRFLQTNRLLVLAKEIQDIHGNLDVALAPPPNLAESQLAGDETDWLSILDSPDVRTIIGRAKKTGLRGTGSSEHLAVSAAKYPPWFPVHLLYQKATTPQDILSSVELVHQQLSTSDASTANALIILAVAKLAERKYTATLRGFVWKFCQSSHVPSERHFNLLLRALSLHPRSEETSVLVRNVLANMSRHNMKVSEPTYDALLHRHFVTLKVATAVRKKMKHDKVLPTELHLKYLLRLMVAHRFSRRAAGYLDTIHQRQRRMACRDVTYGPKPRFLENIKATILNTRFLRSFRRPSAALRYIQEMTAMQTKAPIRRFMFRKGKPRILRRIWRRRNIHMNVRDWISALYVASRTKGVTAQAFLTGYRQGAGAYAPSRQAYSTVVRGLLYKHDYANAAALWDESCSLDLPLDTISVGIGTHALAMNGEPHRAFALLEQVHSAQQAWVEEGKGRGRRNARSPDRRPPAEVNLYAVHQLMVALRRMGRPDVVFALWDHMETLYGLLPDVYSLNIILQTARWARKYEDTIRGQLSYLGFGSSIAPPSAVSLDPRAGAASHIFTILDPTKRPWITGRWNTESAGQVALRVVVQMFLGNWPALRHAVPPVEALRRSGRDIALSPVSEAINTVTGRPPFDQSPLIALFLANAPVPYPQIVPTDVTFRAIVDLLVAESLHAEIPLVLTWMRALRIRPSKATLATVLVHWIDVSMDSPFVARIKGVQQRDPYAQLVRWLEDWVGLRNMPGREEMSREMERSAYFRDAQYLDVIRERVSEAEGRLVIRARSAYEEE